MSKLNIMLVLAVLAIQFSCKIGDDDNPVIGDVFQFRQTLKLTNVKKEYSPGDILWLEHTLPGKEMTDVNTGETVRVGNASLGISLNVFDPFSDPDEEVKFGQVPQAGVVVDEDDFEKTGQVRLEWGCPNSSTYALKWGVEFKKKGGYLVYPNIKEPFIQFIFTSSDNCAEVDINNLPPGINFGFAEFFFDVDTNRDQFDLYAAQYPDNQANVTTIQTALDEKRAFFVWVN